MTRPIRIGVTMGDPAGIGPEILLDAFAALSPRVAAGELHLLAIGTASVLERAARAKGLAIALGAGTAEAPYPNVPFAVGVDEGAEIPIGRVGREAGRLAFAAVERAVSTRWLARSTASPPRRSPRKPSTSPVTPIAATPTCWPT